MKKPMNDDLTAQPLPFMFAWGLPILAIIAVNFARNLIPFEATVLVLAAAFAWMGLACLLNARRCHRRHCYYSGPILLAGAIAIIMVGLKLVPPGPVSLNDVTLTTFGLVALTFVSELIWGKYVTPRGGA